LRKRKREEENEEEQREENAALVVVVISFAFFTCACDACLYRARASQKVIIKRDFFFPQKANFALKP